MSCIHGLKYRQCKECRKAEWDRYYAANKNKYIERNRKYRAEHPGYHQASQRRRKYGLTQKEYNDLLASQNGVCAICHKPESRTNGKLVFCLHVDHEHDSGKIRGLLCHRCNAGLGCFLDNPELLETAAKYLRDKF